MWSRINIYKNSKNLQLLIFNCMPKIREPMVVRLMFYFSTVIGKAKLITLLSYPGDSRSWESPEKANNVRQLFIQILLR